MRAFERLWQPDEFWWSIRHGVFQSLAFRFFEGTRAIWMHLDMGVVRGHGVKFDAENPGTLDFSKHAIQHQGRRTHTKAWTCALP